MSVGVGRLLPKYSAKNQVYLCQNKFYLIVVKKKFGIDREIKIIWNNFSKRLLQPILDQKLRTKIKRQLILTVIGEEWYMKKSQSGTTQKTPFKQKLRK